MAQLWGGRFTKETDQLVYNFNASITFDQKFYKQDIEVHLVETLEDETYRVFYMGYTPAPFWSATDLQEKVMVLKKSADGWHVLSNGVAVSPMES